MKLVLSKDVKGIIDRNTNEERLHAKAGDVLIVLLKKGTSSYICDSLMYPGTHIVVFKNQIDYIVPEHDLSDNNENDAVKSDVHSDDRTEESFKHIEERNDYMS